MADDFVTVEVAGLAELKQNLAEFTKKIRVSSVRKALTAGVTVLGEAVQQNTPVDTGLLKSSVGIRVSVSEKEGGGVGVVGFGSQGSVARMVEFGHLKRARRVPKGKKTSGAVVGHVAPNPFMRQAFDSSKDAASQRFIQTLSDDINTQNDVKQVANLLSPESGSTL